MSVALRGNLKDFGIAEVFQLIGQQRKTGVLELSDRRDRVQLVFDEGKVVSAAPAGTHPHEALGEMLVRCGRLTRERLEQVRRECAPAAQTLPQLVMSRGLVDEESLTKIDDLLTRETIFRVLRWQDGSFDFSAQERVEHGRSRDSLLGAEQILMDGLRMLDEWQSFADQVPSDDLIFQRTGRFDDYREAQGDLPRSQLEAADRVFRLVDGRLPVRRVIDLSLLGTFDATRVLADLRRVGVIEPLDSEGMRLLQRQRQRRRIALPRDSARGWVAALLPLVMLLGLVLASWRPAPTATAFDGFEIERPGLAFMRDAHRVRGAQHALDAFRYLEGRWPEDLAEVEARGLLPPSLASQEAYPYYYSVGDGGALLLAAER
jgi:hypothetical protein